MLMSEYISHCYCYDQQSSLQQVQVAPRDRSNPQATTYAGDARNGSPPLLPINRLKSNDISGATPSHDTSSGKLYDQLEHGGSLVSHRDARLICAKPASTIATGATQKHSSPGASSLQGNPPLNCRAIQTSTITTPIHKEEQSHDPRTDSTKALFEARAGEKNEPSHSHEL